MKNRMRIILLAVLLSAGLTACKGNGSNNNTDSTSSSAGTGAGNADSAASGTNAGAGSGAAIDTASTGGSDTSKMTDTTKR